MIEYTDLAIDAARMVSQSTSGGYTIRFDSIANYSPYFESNTTNINVLIPARYSNSKDVVYLHSKRGERRNGR